MIDLHCHIIPDVDDGARDMETALAMADLAWEQGTKIITATSHFRRPDQPETLSAPELIAGLRKLRAALAQSGCPLRVAPGMELFSTTQLPEILDNKEYLTLNGSKYLLVEFYFDERIPFMNWCFDEIFARDLVPVVAHPERYMSVQNNPGVLGDWFSKGVVIQLNKGSIMGQMGSRAETAAWWALDHGLAHTVASDAHSENERTPGLANVRSLLTQELSREYADLLLDGNPRRILKNNPLAHSL